MIKNRPSFFVLVLALCLVSRLHAEEESPLFYAASAPFEKAGPFEIRVSGGYDFSNPFSNIYSAGLGASYRVHEFITLGVEYTRYTSSPRSTTETLEAQLARYNYKVQVSAPNDSAAGVLRFRPLSGIINLFSWKILMSEVNLLARAGVVDYGATTLCPLLGTGIEFNLAFSSSFGIFASLLVDAEKPTGNEWGWRSGFRVGPSVRF